MRVIVSNSVDSQIREEFGRSSQNSAYYLRMEVTVVIDDDLLERAKALTGIEDINALVHAALEALIEEAKRVHPTN